MKKGLLFTAFLCTILSLGFSQSAEELQARASDDVRINQFYLGLGGSKTTYQDAKYSNTIYNGVGAAFAWGLNRKRSQYDWTFGSTMSYSAEKGKIHKKGIDNINVLFHFDYSRKLNEHFSVGGRWDIFDFNLRRVNGLGNNGNPTIYNSTLLAMGRYSRPLRENIRLNFQLSLGLLALVRESTGFSYSATQKILENGEFDFQDEAQSNPLSLKYSSLEPLFNFNKIYSSLQLEVKNRWVFFYDWTWVNYAEVKGNPLNYATHQIGFQYYIQHKVKAPKKS